MSQVQQFFLRGVKPDLLREVFIKEKFQPYLKVPVPKITSVQTGLDQTRVEFVRDRAGAVHLIGTSGHKAEQCIHCGDPEVCLGIPIHLVGNPQKLTVYMDGCNLCRNFGCMLRYCRDYSSQNRRWDETLIFTLFNQIHPGQLLQPAPPRWELTRFGGFRNLKSQVHYQFNSSPNIKIVRVHPESQT